jgi:hypothetical protein
MISLPFHASVLEPDFYLAVAQTEEVGDFDSSPARQISVEMELLLKFQGLMTSVRRSCPLGVAYVASITCMSVHTVYHELM